METRDKSMQVLRCKQTMLGNLHFHQPHYPQTQSQNEASVSSDRTAPLAQPLLHTGPSPAPLLRRMQFLFLSAAYLRCILQYSPLKAFSAPCLGSTYQAGSALTYGPLWQVTVETTEFSLAAKKYFKFPGWIQAR